MILTITLAILFIEVTKVCQAIVIIDSRILVIIIILIFITPYRVILIISFVNTWKDPFDNDCQLTESLMTFSRNALGGQVPNDSRHKLNNLPESHTDYIISIMNDQLGYIGVIFILLMILFIVFV
ncbi:hypothetical protein FD727_02340 [Pantoea sp. Mhis]|nr:hypothetical protein [Pantoea sp. Mhis]